MEIVRAVELRNVYVDVESSLEIGCIVTGDASRNFDTEV